MNKIAIIKQQAGLGDILFVSKIRLYLESMGFIVYHPVIKEYTFVSEYIYGNFPCIDTFEYIKEYNECGLHPTEFFVDNADTLVYVAPLGTAEYAFGGLIMDAKYKLMNIFRDDWAEYLHIHRYDERENNLLNMLDIKQDDEFILVSNKYASLPKYLEKNIPIQSDCRIIYMDIYDGFTIFDWMKVMELAKEIHCVESAINYILEVMDIDPQKVFMYSRHNPPYFKQIQYLFTKRWNYVY